MEWKGDLSGKLGIDFGGYSTPQEAHIPVSLVKSKLTTSFSNLVFIVSYFDIRILCFGNEMKYPSYLPKTH